jgi:hypothetical protein
MVSASHCRVYERADQRDACGDCRCGRLRGTSANRRGPIRCSPKMGDRSCALEGDRVKKLLLLVSLCALSLTGCRTDKAPATSVCIGDGFGGGDCQLTASSPLVALCVKNANGYYCPPSALKGAWITSEAEEASFASWCFKAPAAVASSVVADIQARILSDKEERRERLIGPELLWAHRGAL